MNKQVVKTLEAAKKVLEENKWIKGALAAKANGHTFVDAVDPTAKCFCSLGALQRVTKQKGMPYGCGRERTPFVDARDFLDEASMVLGKYVNSYSGGRATANYNDQTAQSKKDIYKLFDKAIELAKGKS